MQWQFKREEQEFESAPIGKHRVRIKSAEMAVSKSGNDMLVVQLNVSNSKSVVFHYIVFMVDKPEITNRMLTSFFDSFGISDGDFNVSGYAGKVGGAMLKADGEYTKVHYFLSKKEQTTLPAWVDKTGAGTPMSPQFAEIEEDGELPF